MNEVPHVKPKALGTAGGGAVGAAAGRARPDRQECRPVHPEPGLEGGPIFLGIGLR